MTNLSEKELSAINELLAEEQQLVKKFDMLSQATQDAELKEKFTNISNQHQQHFNAIYSHLQ